MKHDLIYDLFVIEWRIPAGNAPRVLAAVKRGKVDPRRRGPVWRTALIRRLCAKKADVFASGYAEWWIEHSALAGTVKPGNV